MALRFGLFGTGPWSEMVHGPGLAAHADVHLVGVWGRNPAKAADLAARLNCRAYDDVDALLADVDAVAIALPPDVQPGLAIRAANAGRHLLLDKPLALTTTAADEIVAAVERNRVASIVFFMRRFLPAVQSFLADAETRDWDGAQITFFFALFANASPFAASPWRREHGGLWDIGPHALSIVLPALGPVVDLAAMPGRRSTTHLLLRHERGAVSTIALTLDAPGPGAFDEIVFYGPDGRVTLTEPSFTREEAFRDAVSRLVVNAESGRFHDPLGVHFGREVVALLARAAESIAALKHGLSERGQP